MPINNIPGVGPTNADIATAVAAPSAATIATAVAAAVPTTAGITSIVQANAGSPYGGTISHSYARGNGVATYTLTGLSSYKYIKMVWAFLTCTSNGAAIRIRINSDSGLNYMAMIRRYTQGVAAATLESGINTYINLETILNDGTKQNGVLTIPNSNSGAIKQYTMTNAFNDTSSDRFQDYIGAWLSTSAINSISFIVVSGTFDNAQAGAGFYLIGAN